MGEELDELGRSGMQEYGNRDMSVFCFPKWVF
jgi:hypothetical protein